MRVAGVVTRQGTDISALLNDLAGEAADVLTALCIAESGLDAQAFRHTTWPDCSAGLTQVIAANLGYGTYTRPATAAEIAAYRAYMEQPTNALREGWRLLGPILERQQQHPVWSLVAYNVGPAKSRDELARLAEAGRAGSADPLARKTAHAVTHYARAWETAQAYLAPEEETPMPTNQQDFVIGEGFRARIAELGLTPLGHERYFAPGYSFVLTDRGPLWYSADVNQVVGPFAEAS